MKNKEIIREGLEHCIANDCGGCPNLATEYCSTPENFQKEVLDLINRQQAENQKLKGHLEQLKSRYDNAKAEIERLSNSAKQWEDTAKDLFISKEKQQAEIERLTINMNAFGLGMKQEKERADTIRAEAIKEYKNKVENDIVTLLGKPNCFDVFGCLNYRYKEMVGEDK